MSIRARNLTGQARRARKMAERASNLTPAWPRVGAYLSAANRRQFQTEGAYYGTPWAPLSPDYMQWKVRNGYSRRTLVMTGQMRASFTSRPLPIERYSRRSAKFGSNSPIAKYHQHGTRHMPARPIMVATPVVMDNISTIIADYVTGDMGSRLRQAGRRVSHEIMRVV